LSDYKGILSIVGYLIVFNGAIALNAQHQHQDFKLSEEKKDLHQQIKDSPLYLLTSLPGIDLSVLSFSSQPLLVESDQFMLLLESYNDSFKSVVNNFKSSYTSVKSNSVEELHLQDDIHEGILLHIIHSKEEAGAKGRFITYHLVLSIEQQLYVISASYPLHLHPKMGMPCNELFRNIYIAP